MVGTVRTFTESDSKLIYARIKQIAEKTAEAAGATADVILLYEDTYPVTFNDEKLTAEMLPTLQKSAGIENVQLIPADTGAEDFSFFQQKVPGMYFTIGGLPKRADVNASGPHHTPSFIIDDRAFKTGLKATCNLVFDYMEIHQQ